jgi:predicted nucleotidyltransferase
MAHVKAHAAELIEVAASLGATNVCLCGSVARGDDRVSDSAVVWSVTCPK